MFMHLDIDVDLQSYVDLDYKLDYIKDQALTAKYIARGHLEDRMTMFNYFENNVMPQTALEIKDRFTWLRDKVVAVNLLRPGQYLPLHGDLYGRYRFIMDLDQEPIQRWIVMLHDCVPGQMIQIQKQVWGDWQAGDCFGWNNDEMHATYNFSFEPRYALQITGVAS